MRNLSYLSMILLLLGISITNAQSNHYYYYKGEKVPFTLDKQSFIDIQDSLKSSDFQSFKLLDKKGVISDPPLLLWLKADKGGTLWTDQSGNGVSVTLSGNPFTNWSIESGSPLNFNPTNHFINNKDQKSGYYDTDLNLSGSTNSNLSIVLIYIPSSSSLCVLGASSGSLNENQRLLMCNSPLVLDNFVQFGTQSVSGIDRLFRIDTANITMLTVDGNVPDGSFVYINGKEERAFTTYPITVTPLLLTIGATGNDFITTRQGFNGIIAEVLVYGKSLTNNEKNRIQSYLAIKYGIPLDQMTPQPYVNYLGKEIYDADDTFNRFNHGIIGIGQDDGSSLDQRISKSINTNSSLILANDLDFTSSNTYERRTSLGNGNFLMTGNNGESVAFESPFEENENTLMNRVWAFHKTGTVGPVYVALPTSEITVPQRNYLYAVVSNDETFDRSDRFVKMENDYHHWYGKIDPNHGDCLTFVFSDSDLVLDLYIKDSPDDIGEEPNLITKKFWRSPDIWVRNNPDRREEHQNPVYKRNNPNYLYVRVRNRSNVASTGEGDDVKLYWKKAGAISRWAQGWYGSVNFDNGAPGSGPVGTVTIPVIEPGEEAILEFPWQVPNPNDYVDITSNPWHFCFLARIVSERDPMMDEREERYTTTNTKRNNNIAWKNVTAVKASSRKRKCKKWYNCLVKKGEMQSDIRSFGGTISVGNPFDEAKTYSLELVKEDLETGKAIFDEADVSLEMDQTLYNAWNRGGKQSELLKNTNDKKKKLVKGNHATLNNLRFDPNEMGMLNVSFNFLAKELTDKSEFVYHVIQKEAETGEVIGGETYVINKDLQVESEGSVKEDRKLEINNKTISIGNASLGKIIPNPASNTAQLTYNLGGAKSAYLMVTGFYHGATKTSNNYFLDKNSTETTLDLTNYSDGHYQVALVCDGKIVDAKTLIKE